MKYPRVLVIVPAFNEEVSIGKTISSLLTLKENIKGFYLDICVINDGSNDRTSEVINQFHNVELLELPYNLGIGSAMQTGYKYAYNNNYDFTIQFDADGQHNSNDIEKLLSPLFKNESDMVVGSRFIEKTSYKSTKGRRLGIVILSAILYVVTGKKFTDPTSGFRAKNKKVTELFAKYYPKDYPEPEVLIYLYKKGFSIKEIPVNMNDRQGGVSSITPIKSIYYMLKVSLSILMQKLMKE